MMHWSPAEQSSLLLCSCNSIDEAPLYGNQWNFHQTFWNLTWTQGSGSVLSKRGLTTRPWCHGIMVTHTAFSQGSKGVLRQLSQFLMADLHPTGGPGYWSSPCTAAERWTEASHCVPSWFRPTWEARLTASFMTYLWYSTMNRRWRFIRPAPQDVHQ